VATVKKKVTQQITALEVIQGTMLGARIKEGEGVMQPPQTGDAKAAG